MAEADQQSVALVVGGTGMLAGATHWLTARSSRLLLVARRADKFAQNEPTITLIASDWNSGDFQDALSQALKKAPPVKQALLWLHEPDPILDWLLPLIPDARVVIVLGSMDGNPEIPAFMNLVTIRLGSVATSSGRRWLTHDEISEGAIQSMQDGKSRVVGELVSLG